MQKHTCGALALVGLAILAGTSTALAEGKGHGLGKAMASASKASNSSAGLHRATQKATAASARSSNGSLKRAGQGVTRASGLGRSLAGAEESTASTSRSLNNQQRILDKRLEQAQHLRQVSARNGNERLLDTAERMEGSAIGNYERQTGQVYEPLPPETDGSNSLPEGEGSILTDAPAGDASGEVTTAGAGNTAPAPRSAWRPSWLRWGK
jgi:hypothetical protein